MARSQETNNEILMRLKNKPEEDLTREDMKEAMNLAKSTQRIQDKVFYTSVKHQVRLNEENADNNDNNDNQDDNHEDG